MSDSDDYNAIGKDLIHEPVRRYDQLAKFRQADLGHNATHVREALESRDIVAHRRKPLERRTRFIACHELAGTRRTLLRVPGPLDLQRAMRLRSRFMTALWLDTLPAAI